MGLVGVVRPPFATGAPRVPTPVGAVGDDSICPHATAKNVRAATVAPHAARGPVFDGINMNLSFNVSLRNLAFRREPFTTQVVNRACPWA